MPHGELYPLFWDTLASTGFAIYACPRGFELSGNNQTECDANGHWTDVDPNVECIGMHKGCSIRRNSRQL